MDWINLNFLKNRIFILVISLCLGFWIGNYSVSKDITLNKKTYSAYNEFTLTDGEKIKKNDRSTNIDSEEEVGKQGKNLELENTIVMPKESLSAFHMPLFAEGTYNINKDIAALFSMNDSQMKEINNLISNSIEMLLLIEKKNSQIKKDDGGDEFVEIQPFEGSNVMEYLKQGLGSIFSNETEKWKSGSLGALFEKDRMFGFFGKYKQEIFITEARSRIGGGNLMTLNKRYIDDKGLIVNETGSTNDIPLMLTRYNGMFPEK